MFKVEGRGALEGFVAYGEMIPNYDYLVLKLDETFYLFGRHHQYIGISPFKNPDDDHVIIDGLIIFDLHMHPEEMKKLQSAWIDWLIMPVDVL